MIEPISSYSVYYFFVVSVQPDCLPLIHCVRDILGAMGLKLFIQDMKNSKRNVLDNKEDTGSHNIERISPNMRHSSTSL